MRRPLEKLRLLYPWPAEPPNVGKNLSGWFQKSKQELLREVVPPSISVLLELGSWLGQSTMWFLEHAPAATVVAVDTWLGSVEHTTKIRYRRSLPTLHETFLANCWEYRDRLIPIRNTSLMAMQLLKGIGVEPDAIYFDADHSYHGLTSELEMAFEFWPSVIMVGDDWTGEQVDRALRDFCLRRPRFEIESKSFTWHLKREEWG